MPAAAKGKTLREKQLKKISKKIKKIFKKPLTNNLRGYIILAVKGNEC